jgi:hypothetical protein
MSIFLLFCAVYRTFFVGMSYNPTLAVHVWPTFLTEPTPGSRDVTVLIHCVNKEITCLTCVLWNLEVHYRIHNSPTALFWASWIQFTFLLVSLRYISILPIFTCMFSLFTVERYKNTQKIAFLYLPSVLHALPIALSVIRLYQWIVLNSTPLYTMKALYSVV